MAKVRKIGETLTDRVKEIRREPGLDERLHDYRERRRAYDALRSKEKQRQPALQGSKGTERKYRV